MKAFTILVSALATLTAAAPTAVSTEVDKRSFAFDINSLNGLKGFQQVNLNYLLNINSLQLGLLGNLAQVNNFNVLQFQGLFQQQSFDLASLLQLQQLHTFLQIHQLGVLNGFDLGGLQLQQLQLGLLNNVGVLDLQQFISPSVIGQVQTVASQAPVSFIPNLPVSSVPGVDNSVVSAPAPVTGGTSNVVTAAEQDAQEGRSSLE
ncbi:hypothetical protein QBC42DRAFT_285163 [Cladorrhinum samala]|uniref:Uncharacterized protein n=1 Tax=Cladorrhinum samala TaxID=585594 RepID=A0AAV9HSH2_9PEZI|nr:hypothetical protein QBC42DRAFT_285163 [Cladorrhinum samala]